VWSKVSAAAASVIVWSDGDAPNTDSTSTSSNRSSDTALALPPALSTAPRPSPRWWRRRRS
jgi:hypothetical protein